MHSFEVIWTGSVIQDLSGSWCIKGPDESMSRVDPSVSLMHHDVDRSWITVRDQDHPKGTHPKPAQFYKVSLLIWLL